MRNFEREVAGGVEDPRALARNKEKLEEARLEIGEQMEELLRDQGILAKSIAFHSRGFELRDTATVGCSLPRGST